MKLFAKFIVAFLLLCVTPVILAQESCPALVTSALQAVTSTCESTGRNQACYGNISLQAVPQAGVSNFTFEKAGDIVDVSNIQTLTLSSLNADADEWGVALLKVQANVPDTLPGQNVTLLLFGDVEVQNAAEASEVATATPPPTATPAIIEVTANSTINVRGEPSTSGAVVGSLAGSTTVKADGRNAAGDWLHIQLADGTIGWVFAQLVTANGDANTLPETTGEISDVPASTEVAPAEPAYGPMQAFYFKTGVNDSPCSEAPDSGILIQTPEGAGKIDLVINQVNVSLGSTAYVQAQPSGDMVVNVVEGEAQLSASGATITVPAGTRARIPLDADGAANSAPVGPEPYVETDFGELPLGVLPRVISVKPSLTAAEIAALAPGLPVVGTWTSSGNFVTDCSRMFPPEFGLPATDVDIKISNNELDMIPHAEHLDEGTAGFVWPYENVPTAKFDSSGAYTEDKHPLSLSIHYDMQVVSPTHIEGVTTTFFVEPMVCTLTATYTMDFVGP